MLHLVVMPPVSAAIGQLIQHREQLLAVLNRLYDQMENYAARYRGRRDPQDTDLFDYVVNFFDGNGWHTLRFSIDDRQARDGLLFAVGVSHRAGRFRV